MLLGTYTMRLNTKSQKAPLTLSTKRSEVASSPQRSSPNPRPRFDSEMRVTRARAESRKEGAQHIKT